MYKLEPKDYKRVANLIKSDNDLSVFSVIHNRMPGNIFVNDIDQPTSTLIRTSECNLIAGRIDNEEFNAKISDELDFWDPVIPDTQEWEKQVPLVHKNRFIRKYTRCHYFLVREKFIDSNNNRLLPNGFIIEQVNLEFLRNNKFKNSEQLLQAIEDWKSDEDFIKYGGGSYVRNNDEIVSYSLWDCSYLNQVEIGIHTTENYRKKGFGIIAAAETVRTCFEKGYTKIRWTCVQANKGSKAIAKKLGFELKGVYSAFSSYPPIENLLDLSESEWNEWAEYFENSAKTEPNLWTESLVAYIKANNVAKANEVLALQRLNGSIEHNFSGLIQYLHSIGMATDFSENGIHID